MGLYSPKRGIARVESGGFLSFLATYSTNRENHEFDEMGEKSAYPGIYSFKPRSGASVAPWGPLISDVPY